MRHVTGPGSGAMSAASAHGRHSLPNLTRNIQNCAAEERRCRIPLNAIRIHRNSIPDDTIALAADLGTGKLLLQLFSYEMLFVPELNDSWVRDSSSYHPTRL